MPRRHLRHRGQTVLFRRIVPEDLRPRFGQREIVRSLGRASAGEARRMAHNLWDATEALFMMVRFDRSLTTADIARLADQHLANLTLKHDRALAIMGSYPTPEELSEHIDAPAQPSDAGADRHDEDEAAEASASPVPLNDPRTWVDLYELTAKGLRRERATNDIHSVRDAAQTLALKNEFDLDAPSASERMLCRALLDVEIRFTEERLAYLKQEILPYHPTSMPQEPAQSGHQTIRQVDPDVVPKADATELCAVDAAVSITPDDSRLLSDVWTKYSDDQVATGRWKISARTQNQSTLRLFVGICGDRPLSAYSSVDAAEFRRTVLRMPAKYDKDKVWRAIYLKQGARALVAQVGDDATIPRITKKTFNRHLSALSGLWPWAEREKLVPFGEPSIFKGLHINLRRSRGPHHRDRDDRPMWDLEELASILRSPLFRGMVGRAEWSTPGPYVFRDERYWGILVGCHTGMRREEIFQLKVHHVVRHEATGIWHFDLTMHDLELKGTGSYRLVPIHENLLRLGFIEARVLGRFSDDLLFPEAALTHEGQKHGERFGKWFGRFRVSFGVRDDVVFHSLRHFVATELSNSDVSDPYIAEIIGHEHKGRTSEMARYNKGQTLQRLKSFIDRLAVPIDIDATMDAIAKSERVDRKTAWPILSGLA